FFEQDPNQWWFNVRREIKEVLNHVNPRDINGVGACAQMHAPILVDRDGSPLFPSLGWPDLRAIELTDEISSKTGIFQPYFTALAPKILWIKKHSPDLINRTYKFLLPKDFIRMKLSRTFCTDINDANGTAMFDEAKMEWMKSIVEYLGIDMEQLPEVHRSEEVVGTVTREAAEETGLVEGTPVIAGSSDNLGRALDRKAASAGDLLIYLGSGAMIEYISEAGARPKGTYRSILGVAGTAPQWFKNIFGGEDKIRAERQGVDTLQLLDSEAEQLKPGAGGLLFLPHLMGERAYEGRTRSEPSNFNPYARAVLYGMCLGHTRRHIYRAVLEGAVYHLLLCWERIRSLNPGIVAKRIVASGGGAKSRVWRQIIADAFDLPVYLPSETETGNLAVACLISVAKGFSKTFDDAVLQIKNPLQDPVEPNKANWLEYQKMFALYKKLESGLKEMFTPPQ
ncbi:MAG: FGGY family carbohydrate kinase, partial [Candidatus Bathyarchaeia archaeon]